MRVCSCIRYENGVRISPPKEHCDIALDDLLKRKEFLSATGKEEYVAYTTCDNSYHQNIG